MSEVFPGPELHLPQQIVRVGRQPILDRQLGVYGYELLYRTAEDMQQGFDGDVASARTLLNSFLEFGLQRLVGDQRVFINMTQRFFTDLSSLPVDNTRIVIEVLENFEITPEVVSGVQKLHQDGYVIALDDYRFEHRWEPLLSHCSMIKVDILGLSLEDYREQIKNLKSLGLKLLAEKVESREQFEVAKRLGFDLFQGYFFAKPQTLSTTRNPSNRNVLLKTIAKINDPDADVDEIASLVECDTTLSLKVLRVLNSAATSLPRVVNSIREAVVLIGMNRIRAWSTLILMADYDETSPELITTSLVRAELCKLLAEEFKTGHPDSGYTVGLLSTLDAVLNAPMEGLLNEIPLPQDMLDALRNQSGPLGRNLKCAVDLERCEWMSETVKFFPVERLNTVYVRALEAVETIRREFSACNLT